MHAIVPYMIRRTLHALIISNRQSEHLQKSTWPGYMAQYM